FMIPIMSLPLLMTKKLFPLVAVLIKFPVIFFKWGILGFGGLYTCIALASLYLPGWLIAAIFQINILAGMLIAPFIYNDHRKKIPLKALTLSLFIVLGVLVMQLDRLTHLQSIHSIYFSFLLILIGAFVWPMANRKLLVDLEQKGINLNAMQRVMGLTVGSTPLLLLLVFYAYAQSGIAPITQIQASLYSAVFSGFLGGVCFYQATQMVKHNPIALATVEATQVFEILFALVGEMVLINAPMPSKYALLGMLLIGVAMLVQVLLAVRTSRSFASSIGGKSDFSKN
ncbi:MAG TPA: multidrug resistance efflux transporter family protein, partial [Pseudosphingobacterium sp.]|nr:multidrug resistance efflux transporter family protein [Pseudosphingobacterium sp.]